MPQPETNGERLVRLETIVMEVRDDVKSLLLREAAHELDDKIRFGEVDKNLAALKSRMDKGAGVIAAFLFLFTLFGDFIRAAILGR